jgi:hypothetical protein
MVAPSTPFCALVPKCCAGLVLPIVPPLVEGQWTGASLRYWLPT